MFPNNNTLSSSVSVPVKYRSQRALSSGNVTGQPPRSSRHLHSVSADKKDLEVVDLRFRVVSNPRIVGSQLVGGREAYLTHIAWPPGIYGGIISSAVTAEK